MAEPYRADGWSNIITGLGVEGTDKRLAMAMGYITTLSDQVLSSLYHSDPIAAKIVTLLPDEALSQGFGIEGPEPEQVSDWMTAVDDLQVVPTLRRAAIFSRLYGGGVIVLGVDDGQISPEAQALPLREESIRSLQFLKFVDRRNLTRIGEDVYRITGRQGQTLVHVSRTVPLGGADTDDEMREDLDGWDLSVLQRVHATLRDNASAWGSVDARLLESSYAKAVIKDLAALMAAGKEQAVKNRLAMINYAKSTARTVILDSEESYERDTDNLSGIGDILEMHEGRVAAAACMPVTKLFGTSAKGLNATGEGDAKDWARQVQSHREGYLTQPLEAILWIIAVAQDGPFGGKPPEAWDVTWPELEPMSDKERAEIYKTNTEADAIAIQSQVLDPEEVALHRYRETGYESGYGVEIDRAEREEALKLGQDLAMEALKNPPPEPDPTAPTPDPTAPAVEDDADPAA